MIYLDNAATTRTDPDAALAMLPYMTDFYGNPSADYGFAIESRRAVANERNIIADFIGAEPNEIIFTSGGTEADNMVTNSLAHSSSRWFLTSTLEHKAILNSINENRTIFIPNDMNGIVSADRIAGIQDGDVVSVMFANNELGTIQPITEIAEKVHEAGAYLHTDAVQAFGHVPINVKKMGIDMMSASGHKMGAPKGIGFLYVKKDLQWLITPIIRGGGQENHYRAGTENVPAIVGFGKAVEIARNTMDNRYIATKKLRDYFEDQLLKEVPNITINGRNVDRLPGHSSITFHGVRAEELLSYLDIYGICASSGSACNTGDEQPSHVLKAIGLTDNEANSTLRFSMNHRNTKEELNFTIGKIKEFLSIKNSH